MICSPILWCIHHDTLPWESWTCGKPRFWDMQRPTTADIKFCKNSSSSTFKWSIKMTSWLNLPSTNPCKETILMDPLEKEWSKKPSTPPHQNAPLSSILSGLPVIKVQVSARYEIVHPVGSRAPHSAVEIGGRGRRPTGGQLLPLIGLRHVQSRRHSICNWTSVFRAYFSCQMEREWRNGSYVKLQHSYSSYSTLSDSQLL